MSYRTRPGLDENPAVGFAPEEIDPTISTRAARLKWVVVVNADLPPGRGANAANRRPGETVGTPGLG